VGRQEVAVDLLLALAHEHLHAKAHALEQPDEHIAHALAVGGEWGLGFDLDLDDGRSVLGHHHGLFVAPSAVAATVTTPVATVASAVAATIATIASAVAATIATVASAVAATVTTVAATVTTAVTTAVTSALSAAVAATFSTAVTALTGLALWCSSGGSRQTLDERWRRGTCGDDLAGHTDQGIAAGLASEDFVFERLCGDAQGGRCLLQGGLEVLSGIGRWGGHEAASILRLMRRFWPMVRRVLTRM
jgi:hypothetical protein